MGKQKTIDSFYKRKTFNDEQEAKRPNVSTSGPQETENQQEAHEASQIPNASMASSSSSPHSTPTSYPSYKYDVFLNFRGQEVRKNFIDHLYTALKNRRICTYKDDQTLLPGESMNPCLFEAIKVSQIAVTVFSQQYANSVWCLKELDFIMKQEKEGKLIVVPIFYNVTPSEMRSLEGPFGIAFAELMKQNIAEAESWRNALYEASQIRGHEPWQMAGGFQAKAIDEIVDAISNRLLSSLNSLADKDLVGMEDRLQELEPLLDIHSVGTVRMVGIWGLGGIGKTTLATSLRKKISQDFFGNCILENVRDKVKKNGLEKLQENILIALHQYNKQIQSVDDGKKLLKQMLGNKKVLVVLDDVSHGDQLEALAGDHNWFGEGSRIIITTRNKQLLKDHRVDVTYGVRLLSDTEATKLFSRYVHSENLSEEDFMELSKDVVSYAAGLPLAIKHLAKCLCCKNMSECRDLLRRLKTMPNQETMDVLRINYDGLEARYKDLFLDIACFWRKKRVDEAIKILDARGFSPIYGIGVLKQNAFILDDDRLLGATFDMHDLVETMGHYIVRGANPNNPEEHSRVWEPEKIRNLCIGDEAILRGNVTIEAIKFNYESDHDHDCDLSSCFSNIVSNMKGLKWLSVNSSENADAPAFLSNKLVYLDWRGYSAHQFPESFRPTYLVCLKVEKSMQRELWRGLKYLPKLKELCLIYMYVLYITPNFNGLKDLQELRLVRCKMLKEIPESIGALKELKSLTVVGCPITNFPTHTQLNKLEALEVVDCKIKQGSMLSSIGELSNLQELDLRENLFSQLGFSLSKLTRLKLLNMSECKQLQVLPELPLNLAILKAEDCPSLERFEIGHIVYNCLREVSLRKSGFINDGSMLLQSMIEGEDIENGYMLLHLKGFEVAERFQPTLVIGKRYRLQLQENWCNAFSGFLICAAVSPSFDADSDSGRDNVHILVKQADVVSRADTDWKKSAADRDMYTWVRYVSFGSLRGTTWWKNHQTSEALEFTILSSEYCAAVGVRLVKKKASSSSTIDKYNPPVKVDHEEEEEGALTLSLPSMAESCFPPPEN